MTDTDKIIDGLTKARNYLDVQQRTYESVFHACDKPVKVNAFDESIAAIDEAIERLKAQEPMPVKRWATKPFSPFCPNIERCGYPLEEGQPFCWHCGQAIKWE